MISFSGIGAVPVHFEAWLIDRQNERTHDLRKDTTYQMTPVMPLSVFTILIGDQAAIRDKLATVHPTEYALGMNFPNPFNQATTLSFSLQRPEKIIIDLFDRSGRHVRRILEAALPAGENHVSFDGANLASGLYFCEMTSATDRQICKLTLMK